MSIETMTKLATVTASTSVSSIDFSNIPQTYTDLKLVLSLRTNRSSGDFGSLEFLINNDSTTSYADRITYNYNSSALSNTDTGYTTLYMGGVNQTTQTSNVFSSHELYIPNYTSSKYKTLYGEWAAENNGTVTFMGLGGGIWKKTEAINRITISVTGFTFNQYSTATLYGVKAMRTVVGNSIKATGGAISFDGTYVYHAFGYTDSFIPNRQFLADYLVVAGGGGAVAGGGGAGGLLTGTSQVFNPNTTYAVTVGAGGVGAAYAQSSHTNGANSSISGGNLPTINAIGGGRSGTTDASPQDGQSGGSGGGAGGAGGTNVGGSGTAGQGYAGGNGMSPNGAPYPGGGGGGAGAAGATATNSGTYAGAGGIGATSALINALAIGTSTGELYNGNYYFAGGGAGGNAYDNTNAAAQGGKGGGASGRVGSNNGYSGTVNTGGGGGGATQVVFPRTGGNGGSGIVIIRYKA